MRTHKRQFILPLVLLLGVGLWVQFGRREVPGEQDSYPAVVRYTDGENSRDTAAATKHAAAYREKRKASKEGGGVLFTPKHPSAPSAPVSAINAEGENVVVTFPIETVTTAGDISSLPEALKPWEKEIKAYLEVQDRLRPVLHAPMSRGHHSQQAWLAMGEAVSAEQSFETPEQIAERVARIENKQQAALELRQATYVLHKALGDNRREFEEWQKSKELLVAISPDLLQ